MSEYFSHAVHGDDTAALVSLSPRVGDTFKTSLANNRALISKGSIIRLGQFIYPKVLKDVRETQNGSNRSGGERRLAIALSCLSHRAVDHYFKPLYRELAPEYYDNEYALSPSQIRITQDIVLYSVRKGMKLADGDPKYDPAMFNHLITFIDSQDAGAARRIETVFGGVVLQELLNTHDLIPGDKEEKGRISAYVKAVDPVYIDTSRYAVSYAEPNQNQIQRYVIEPNFYDPADPLIALAVQVQNGEGGTSDDLEAALADEASHSQWGQSLLRGVRYIEAAQSYIDGKLTDDELMSATTDLSER